jgi:arginase family enzyme
MSSPRDIVGQADGLEAPRYARLLSSRKLMTMVRGFLGADVVEVAPTYDQAEITGIVATNLAYGRAALLEGALTR